MLIRVIATPPGEAPEHVREAWVGLELPVVDRDGRARTWRTSGVLSGPKSFIAALFAVISGKTSPVAGFRVDAAAAIDLLAARKPDAASWWRAHAPRFCEPGRQFVFHASVCQLLDDSESNRA